MNFFSALRAMKMGKGVRRPCFSKQFPELLHIRIDTVTGLKPETKEFVGRFKTKGESRYSDLGLSLILDDVEATDWEILDD